MPRSARWCARRTTQTSRLPKPESRKNARARPGDRPGARSIRQTAVIFAFMGRGILAAVLLASVTSALGQLDRFTQRETQNALRGALEQGAQAAVAALGRL